MLLRLAHMTGGAAALRKQEQGYGLTVPVGDLTVKGQRPLGVGNALLRLSSAETNLGGQCLGIGVERGRGGAAKSRHHLIRMRGGGCQIAGAYLQSRKVDSRLAHAQAVTGIASHVERHLEVLPSRRKVADLLVR